MPSTVTALCRHSLDGATTCWWLRTPILIGAVYLLIKRWWWGWAWVYYCLWLQSKLNNAVARYSVVVRALQYMDLQSTGPGFDPSRRIAGQRTRASQSCVTSASEFTTVWRSINLINLIYCKNIDVLLLRKSLSMNFFRHSSRDISVQNASDYQ